MANGDEPWHWSPHCCYTGYAVCRPEVSSTGDRKAAHRVLHPGIFHAPFVSLPLTRQLKLLELGLLPHAHPVCAQSSITFNMSCISVPCCAGHWQSDRGRVRVRGHVCVGHPYPPASPPHFPADGVRPFPRGCRATTRNHEATARRTCRTLTATRYLILCGSAPRCFCDPPLPHVCLCVCPQAFCSNGYCPWDPLALLFRVLPAALVVFTCPLVCVHLSVQVLLACPFDMMIKIATALATAEATPPVAQ